MLRNLTFGLLIAAMPLSASMAQTPARGGDEAHVREIHAMFAEMDRNGDGKVSRIEMTSYGHSKGIRGMVSPKAWKRMDADRNGTISMDEFTKDMIRYYNQRKR